jgi:hypothetical protein
VIRFLGVFIALAGRQSRSVIPVHYSASMGTISYCVACIYRREPQENSLLLRRIVLLLLVIVAPSMAQQSENRRDKLAAAGQIDEKAPVRASSEILISAPVDKVWQLLSGIDDWPKWQSTISMARTSGPVQPGTEFTWIMGGTRIKSRLALVVPGADLAWTGTALGTKAIHIWHLKALDGGRTLVSTKESMSGFMLKILYSSKKLEKSQREWLEALKRASER